MNYFSIIKNSSPRELNSHQNSILCTLLSEPKIMENARLSKIPFSLDMKYIEHTFKIISSTNEVK